jgi:hypothetical protein
MVINGAHRPGPPRIDHLQRIRELVRSGGTADLDHWGDGKLVIQF